VVKLSGEFFVKMLTPDQLEQRRTGIGGSDAAAIAGLSRYKTNVDVYLEKHRLKAVDNEESEPAYWGSVLEALIADEYAKRTGKEIIREANLLRHGKYTWMIANVDRIIKGEGAILECKTCSAFKYKEWGADGSDEIPDEYLLQCAHYAIVTDAKYVDIALLMGGQHFGIYNYQRNKRLEDSLIELEHDFWHNHILPQVPPEPKGYADACKLFSEALGAEKKTSAEIEDEVYKFYKIKKQVGELMIQAEKHKTNICNYLGNDSILVNDFGLPLATWKNKKSSRFNLDLFKQKHSQLYKQFLKVANARDFRVKVLENE
jgi:putative phage-type endonuclease